MYACYRKKYIGVARKLNIQFGGRHIKTIEIDSSKGCREDGYDATYTLGYLH